MCTIFLRILEIITFNGLKLRQCKSNWIRSIRRSCWKYASTSSIQSRWFDFSFCVFIFVLVKPKNHPKVKWRMIYVVSQVSKNISNNNSIRKNSYHTCENWFKSISECSGLLKIFLDKVSFPIAVFATPDWRGVPFLNWKTDWMYPIGLMLIGMQSCACGLSSG